MKTRIFIPFLIFAGLMFSACTPAVKAPSGTEVTARVDMKPPEVFIDSETSQTGTRKCSRSSDEVRLLINSVQGYCLQYPPEYDVFAGYPNGSQIMLFKRSVLNTTEPSVSIKVQPAGDVNLERAAEQIAQVYAIPGTEPIPKSLTIDGEAAIMLAGLSGQDPNRQVVVQHSDQLYSLFFIEVNKNDPDVYAQFETLYNTVIQSFNFSPETNACPDCRASSDTIQEVPPAP